MKEMYYSEKVRKYFDNKKECEEAEKKYDEEHAAELKAQEERKDAAAKVDEAYKKYSEAQKVADGLYRDWLTARNEFVKKYKFYHMTYSDEDGEIKTVSEVLDTIFKPWFF